MVLTLSLLRPLEKRCSFRWATPAICILILMRQSEAALPSE